MNDIRLLIEFDEFEDNVEHLPRRYIRDKENPIEFFSDVEFKRRYRFTKNSVLELLLPIMENLQKINNRGLPISPLISLLITLRFYATGNFQTVCGDLRGIHQSSVCKIVNKVSRLIAAKAQQNIKYPNNMELIYQQFYKIAQFPSVSGCIDCTHIPIRSPGGDMAEVFRNRKGTFSINVQAISGPNLEIFDLVAWWPGREHDSTIFNNSRVKGRYEDKTIKGYLLGDSGYPCLPYLMTPLLNPSTNSENRYNRAQIRTRNVVERMFGVLKRRFPCLSRVLANKIHTVCVIIVACCVLHNISIIVNDDLPDDSDDEDDYVNDNDDPLPPQNRKDNAGSGQAIRRALIQRYF